MNKIIEMLKDKYGIHSAILYGSRTTETFFIDSDYDILAIRKSGDRVREAFIFDDKVIDLIIETENLIDSPENYIYLWSHQILLDESGFCEKLIIEHQNYLNQPALKLPANRVIQRKKQIADEIKYISRGNLLGHYRQHDLLSKILPLYFNLIGEWYLGDKHALNWIKQNKPDLYRIFSEAIHPQATIDKIKVLVETICQQS